MKQNIVTWLAGRTMYSQRAPLRGIGIADQTPSPTLRSSTPTPTSTTVPEKSRPRTTELSSDSIWRSCRPSPDRMRMSAGSTDPAWTRIRTWSGERILGRSKSQVMFRLSRPLNLKNGIYFHRYTEVENSLKRGTSCFIAFLTKFFEIFLVYQLLPVPSLN